MPVYVRNVDWLCQVYFPTEPSGSLSDFQSRYCEKLVVVPGYNSTTDSLQHRFDLKVTNSVDSYYLRPLLTCQNEMVIAYKKSLTVGKICLIMQAVKHC